MPRKKTLAENSIKQQCSQGHSEISVSERQTLSWTRLIRNVFVVGALQTSVTLSTGRFGSVARKCQEKPELAPPLSVLMNINNRMLTKAASQQHCLSAKKASVCKVRLQANVAFASCRQQLRHC